VGSSAPFVSLSADGLTGATSRHLRPAHPAPRRLGNGSSSAWATAAAARRRSRKLWIDSPEVKAVDTLVDVTYGAGKFVGVACTACAWRPRTGSSGRTALRREGEHINSVLWTGDRFVAVGQGATYFSPDGLDWTRKENKDAPLIAVYGAGVFVGTSGRGASCSRRTRSSGARSTSASTTSKPCPTADSYFKLCRNASRSRNPRRSSRAPVLRHDRLSARFISLIRSRRSNSSAPLASRSTIVSVDCRAISPARTVPSC